MISNLGNSASKSKKFHGEQEGDAVGNLTRKLTQLKKQIQADRAVSVKANEMSHHHGNLAGYLAYFTGQSLEKIHQDTDHDYFMSPKEATEYGLIDGIISNPLKALQPLAAAADQQQ